MGFVTFTHEMNAQFAKEAMMHQSLDNDEVLNVRSVFISFDVFDPKDVLT